MSEIFNDELKRLRSHFMEMGIDASEQIYQATQAFTNHDPELAKQVLSGDSHINTDEVNLEKQALKLMALQQPVAADFRKIISILKASTDIERIGDYASHIAQCTVSMADHYQDQAIQDNIQQMMMIVRKMLEQIMDAYVFTDEKTAYKVANEDLKVDVLYVEQQKQIIAALKASNDHVTSYETYLNVIRYLERAGDHIVNLAEWIIYSGSGELVELNPGKADHHLVERKLREHHTN